MNNNITSNNHHQSSSNTDYLSFMNQYQQQLKSITIHQNQYFTISSPSTNNNNNNNNTNNNNSNTNNNNTATQKHQEHYIINFKGLVNTKLNILQTYQLLNPFDKIYTKHSKSPSSTKYYQSKSQKITKLINQLKELQNLNKKTYQSKPINQTNNKQIVNQQNSNNKTKQSQLITNNKSSSNQQHKVDINSNNQYQHDNDQKQQSQNNNSDIEDKNQIKQPQIYYKYSLFFLYYIKKIYNNLWSNFIKPQQENKQIVQNIQNAIQNYQIKLIYSFYKVHGDKIVIDGILELFQLLQFDKHPIKQSDKDYHLGMQQFIFYKLHKSYGIRSRWSNKYELQLRKINQQTFSIYYQLQCQIQQTMLPIGHIQQSILDQLLYPNSIISYQQHQKILSVRKDNNNKQHHNNNKNNNRHKNNKQHYEREQIREIISFLIQNIHNYQSVEEYQINNYNQLELFGLTVSKNDANTNKSDNNNDTQQQSSPLATILRFYTKLQPLQYLTPSIYFKYTQSSFNKPIHLYQLQQPSLAFNHSYQQMFDKLVQFIVKLFKKYITKNISQHILKYKKYLIEVNSETLIWRQDHRTVQIDKFQLWKLLFGLEYQPTIVQMGIVNIDRYMCSMKNIIRKTIRDLIRDQIQPIAIMPPLNKVNNQLSVQDHQKQSMQNHRQPNYLFLFPFIHLIVLAYELFSPTKPIQKFVIQLKSKYQKLTLQQNLLLFVKDIHQQLIQKIQQKQTHSEQHKNNRQQQQSTSLLKYTNQLVKSLANCHKHLIQAGIQLTNTKR